MPYRKNRPRPRAVIDSNDHPWARVRPIILSTGRADVKITPAEALELAAELTAAAEKLTAPTPGA